MATVIVLPKPQSGGSSGYPEVNTFADLPSAGSVSGALYIVRTTTGIWPVRKLSGLYRSLGSSWDKLNNLAPDDIKSLYESNADTNAFTNQLLTDANSNTSLRHVAASVASGTGLSIAGQEISLQTASASQPGSLATADFLNFSRQRVLFFADFSSFPLASIADQDTIYVSRATNLQYRSDGAVYSALSPSTGGGGVAVFRGTVNVDFGSSPRWETDTVVNNANVTANSTIMVQVDTSRALSHPVDETQAENWFLQVTAITPGVSFTLTTKSQDGRVFGTYPFKYSIFN